VEEFHFTRHKFLLVTVNEWLKSVLNYRSYPKNKTGYPFLDNLYAHHATPVTRLPVRQRISMWGFSASSVDLYPWASWAI